MMRELSLFSGAAGGLLGTHHLLGWECIGYVEIDDYCQRVLRARIDDGLLSDAPIFGDIRAFNVEHARSYRGLVDVVTGGFPCQPFSVAGQQRGSDDPRNMWPATIECIRLVRPRFVFLENVRALLTSGYFGRVVGDLADSGFGCRWRCVSAAEVGAPHKRDRLWIIGVPNALRPVAQSGAGRRGVREGDNVGHPDKPPQNSRAPQSRPRYTTCKPSRWPVEPPVGRVVNGVADRVGQLRALGNGQVPRVVKAAWELLTDCTESNPS